MTGLCLILDGDLMRESPERILRQALAAGVSFFQYRGKRSARRTVYDTALPLARIAREAGALFLVNDHADIAAAVDADGVHLGQDDLPVRAARAVLGPGKIIGISTHSIDEAREAENAGADYIGFGSVFTTSTKDAGAARGTAAVSIIKQTVSIPVIAIGGINAGNIREVIQAGADGVAVISAVLSATDVRLASETLLGLIAEVRRKA